MLGTCNLQLLAGHVWISCRSATRILCTLILFGAISCTNLYTWFRVCIQQLCHVQFDARQQHETPDRVVKLFLGHCSVLCEVCYNQPQLITCISRHSTNPWPAQWKVEVIMMFPKTETSLSCPAYTGARWTFWWCVMCSTSVCVCMAVCLCVPVSVFLCVCVCLCLCVCIFMSVSLCLCVLLSVCLYLYVCVYVCVSAWGVGCD